MLRIRLASYLLRETSWLYVLGISAFFLLLSIDFLSVWAKFFVENDASLATIARLMLFKLPFFLHLSMPIAGVFAVLLATGRLAKDSELKAAYSSGIAPLSLLVPLLAFGLIISLLLLLNNGYLEPQSNDAYDREVNSFFYQRPPAETQLDASFFIEGEGIYYAGRIRSEAENRGAANLSGVLVIQQDGSIISAKNGIWDSGERLWVLTDAELLTKGEEPQQLNQIALPFDTSADTATALAKPASLTLSELRQRAQNIRAAGGDTRTVAYEFHKRLADAFSAFIFILIAAVLGLHLHGRSAGFAWTIVLLVLFYFLWTLSGNLFDQRVLSPAAAAWMTSAVVGAVGVILALLRLR